jgi:hypothetical protein
MDALKRVKGPGVNGKDDATLGMNGSTVRLACAGAVASGAEDSTLLLFVEPPQEFLESGVLQNLFDAVEFVTKLVVRPGFVDEVFARMAGRHDITTAFATWDHMVAAGRDVSFAEDAGIVHTFQFILPP